MLSIEVRSVKSLKWIAQPRAGGAPAAPGTAAPMHQAGKTTLNTFEFAFI